MARRTRWLDTLIGQGVSSGSQAAIELQQSAADIDVREWTVTRLIGTISLSSATVAGAWGTQRCDMGIGVISREAVNAGSFPDPNDENDLPSSGWMWRTRAVPMQNGTGTAIVTHVNFDIRAQRKLGFAIAHLIINNGAASGTGFTVTVDALIRMLVLLP